MDSSGIEFEWDPRKERTNRAKHGVEFAEAASAVLDPMSITREDLLNSDDEERYFTVGMSSKLRVLAVVWSPRSEVVRLISARKATSSERREYEEDP